MSTAYTPGPYRVGLNPGPIIYTEGGEQIADMREPMPYISAEENMANARRMAAAPELAEALADLVKMVADGDWTTIELEAARAALRKAGV